MARKELRTDDKVDTFSKRSYLIKNEVDTSLLDPDWLVRRMADAHRGVHSKKAPTLKLKIYGPIRECLEFTKTVRLMYPRIKYRVMKNNLDRNVDKDTFVCDAVRVYIELIR